MTIFNHMLGTIFDQIMIGLGFIPAGWGLILFSVISGVILLLIYGQVSWQSGIAKIKVQIMAALREVILFRHDAFLTIRAQGRMFVYGLAYLLIALPPVIILAVPCIILLAQLNQYYGVRPLSPGEASIVSVAVDNSDDLYRISLKGGEGLELSPPVRVMAEKEAYWRVRQSVASATSSAGPTKLSVTLETDNAKEEFPVAFAPSKRIDEVYRSNSWWRNLFFGAEKGVGLLSVREISINYPDREYKFLGLSLNWIVIFFLVSLLSGWVTSRVFHVEI
jgi:hypothetical protein